MLSEGDVLTTCSSVLSSNLSEFTPVSTLLKPSKLGSLFSSALKAWSPWVPSLTLRSLPQLVKGGSYVFKCAPRSVATTSYLYLSAVRIVISILIQQRWSCNSRQLQNLAPNDQVSMAENAPSCTPESYAFLFTVLLHADAL